MSVVEFWLTELDHNGQLFPVDEMFCFLLVCLGENIVIWQIVDVEVL